MLKRMLQPVLSSLAGAIAFILIAPAVLAAPSLAADLAAMTACQAPDPAAAIPACTGLIGNAGTENAEKAKAYAARAVALVRRAFDEDNKSGQDWNDCLSAAPDAALAACTRIIDNTSEYDGRRADALYNRSKLLLEKGRNQEAMADFQRSLNTFSDHQPGSREQALEDYSDALKLDPANSRWFAARGQLYLALDSAAPALADFDKALAISAHEGMALFGRALLRDAKGDPAGALADLKAIAALPTDTDEAKWLNKTAIELMKRLGAD